MIDFDPNATLEHLIQVQVLTGLIVALRSVEFRSELKEIICDVISSDPRNDEQVFFSHKEAAEYLGISPNTLYSYASQRKIPVHKLTKGKRGGNYYLKTDLLDCLRMNRTKTDKEIEAEAEVFLSDQVKKRKFKKN